MIIKKADIKQSILKRFCFLLLGILLILLFMFGVAPLIDKAPYVRVIVELIEDRSIEATALYYTDIEEFSEAAINMENTMNYMPKGFEAEAKSRK